MDSSDNTPVIKKRCNKCGEEKPVTLEYFYSHKGHGDGFATFCKQCARDAQYKSRSIAQAVTPDKMKIYYREYRKRNREKVSQSEKERQKRRHARPLWLETARRYSSEYRKRNPHTVQANRHYYRARKHALPLRWDGRDWQRCLNYWHNTCAVCGSQLRDLFGNVEPHADHWIPLSYKGADNPGTVPTNMLCLCNSCNCSKKDRMPDAWLMSIYGKRRTTAILKRVAAYFEYTKGQVQP